MIDTADDMESKSPPQSALALPARRFNMGRPVPDDRASLQEPDDGTEVLERPAPASDLPPGMQDDSVACRVYRYLVRNPDRMLEHVSTLAKHCRFERKDAAAFLRTWVERGVLRRQDDVWYGLNRGPVLPQPAEPPASAFGMARPEPFRHGDRVLVIRGTQAGRRGTVLRTQEAARSRDVELVLRLDHLVGEWVVRADQVQREG